MRYLIIITILCGATWLSYNIGIADGYDESRAYYELVEMKQGDEVRIKKGDINTILTCTRKFRMKNYCFGGMTFEIHDNGGLL